MQFCIGFFEVAIHGYVVGIERNRSLEQIERSLGIASVECGKTSEIEPTCASDVAGCTAGWNTEVTALGQLH